MRLFANRTAGLGRFRAGMLAITAAAAVTAALGSAPAHAAPSGAPGASLPVTQSTIDWSAMADAGITFVGMKATEGTSSVEPTFADNFAAAHRAGLVRGAYHFALPNQSGGAAQADFFVAHGGDWSADDATLPPVLDIEYNPSGATCYGLSQTSMVSWISAFSDEVQTKTGRYPMIYTTSNWWQTCTGGSDAVAETDPLWATGSASTGPSLPPGFTDYTIWQYDTGAVPGVPGTDTGLDVFHGNRDQLLDFANNG